jgi:hypothetical protein
MDMEIYALGIQVSSVLKISSLILISFPSLISEEKIPNNFLFDQQSLNFYLLFLGHCSVINFD